jgi:hypothetical protein
MADSVTKYVTIKGNLYRIEEYTYRGYGGSFHTSSNMFKVPDNEVEKIKRLVEAKGEKIEER